MYRTQLWLPGFEPWGMSDGELLEQIERICRNAASICWPGTFLPYEKGQQAWVQSAEVAGRLGFTDKGHWHLSRYLTSMSNAGMLKKKIRTGWKYYRVVEGGRSD